MRLLTLCVLALLLVLIVDAKPKAKKPARQPNPAVKIFEFIDKKKEGKVPVAEVKSQIKRMLPLSDDKNIDSNSDGFVTLPEFRQFFNQQYKKWKEANLQKH